MASHQTRDYDKLLVQIVSYVYDKDISTDQNALRMAKCSLLDALGCASESIATNRDVHKLIGHYVPGTIVPNGFHLPGTSLILDPVKGAFDLGVLIRYLDHNDGFTGLEWGHPSGKHAPATHIIFWPPTKAINTDTFSMEIHSVRSARLRTTSPEQKRNRSPSAIS